MNEEIGRLKSANSYIVDALYYLKKNKRSACTVLKINYITKNVTILYNFILMSLTLEIQKIILIPLDGSCSQSRVPLNTKYLK